MGLLRYQVFASYVAAIILSWLWALNNIESLPLSPQLHPAITFAPLLVVVAVGLYLLSVLVVGVLSFRDCPEAAKELDRDVKAAKADLRSRGII